MDKTPWQICKQAILNMPSNFDQVVKSMQEKTPERVVRQHQKKGTLINVYFPPIQGYEVELEIHHNNEKGVVLANYYAWNNETNTCFVRDLLHEPLETGLTVKPTL